MIILRFNLIRITNWLCGNSAGIENDMYNARIAARQWSRLFSRSGDLSVRGTQAWHWSPHWSSHFAKSLGDFLFQRRGTQALLTGSFHSPVKITFPPPSWHWQPPLKSLHNTIPCISLACDWLETTTLLGWRALHWTHRRRKSKVIIIELLWIWSHKSFHTQVNVHMDGF